MQSEDDVADLEEHDVLLEGSEGRLKIDEYDSERGQL